MKNISISLLAIATLLAVTSCGCRENKKAAVATEPAKAPEVETYFSAIDRYLTEQIGKQYLEAEVCIPFYSYTAVDESNQDDILVWGDFWVDNYNVVGDTLMFVSGGNHPGKMHVRQDADGHFEVTAFDAVGDGSEFLSSAKEIFGDKFDAFQAANSDDTKRAECRTNTIAGYVQKHQLPVKVYKDYGWPAVTIPEIK